jgi:hypothetical protein
MHLLAFLADNFLVVPPEAKMSAYGVHGLSISGVENQENYLLPAF